MAVAGIVAALLVAGCGAVKVKQIVVGPGQLHITSLTLSPETGFPGPPTDIISVHGGAELARLVGRCSHGLRECAVAVTPAHVCCSGARPVSAV
jgi:hypothetical protein